MMRSFFPVLILLTYFLNPSLLQTEVVEQLAHLLKTGNAKEISKKFSAAVEISMNDIDDTYSKAQAEQILRDFFVKNVPQNATVVHLINTNPNYQFGVLSLQTKNGKFRVAVTLKKTDNTFFITELRMEAEK